MTKNDSRSNSLRKFVHAANKRFRAKYFLSDGAVLGLVRENGFISADPDLDFGMFAEDFSPQLIDDLAAAGFSKIMQMGSIEDGLAIKFHDGLTQVDLTLFYRTGNNVHCIIYQKRNRIRLDYEAFTLQPAIFCGVEVIIPQDTEKYLETRYGPAWRTPATCWSYAFSPDNASPEGHWTWQTYFAWRRFKWKLRCLAQSAGLLHLPAPCPELPPVELRGNTADTGLIFTDGAFDMLHANHVAFLEDCKKRGEFLVVGVVSDEIVTSYKRRPIIHENERLAMVQSLACVDEAFILRDPLNTATMEKLLEKYNPRAVVYSGTATPDFYVAAKRAGIMVTPDYRKGICTSKIIDQIVGRPDLNPKLKAGKPSD